MKNVYKLSVKTCILYKIWRLFKLNQRSCDKKQQAAWGKGVQHEGKHVLEVTIWSPVIKIVEIILLSLWIFEMLLYFTLSTNHPHVYIQPHAGVLTQSKHSAFFFLLLITKIKKNYGAFFLVQLVFGFVFLFFCKTLWTIWALGAASNMIETPHYSPDVTAHQIHLKEFFWPQEWLIH